MITPETGRGRLKRTFPSSSNTPVVADPRRLQVNIITCGGSASPAARSRVQLKGSAQGFSSRFSRKCPPYNPMRAGHGSFGPRYFRMYAFPFTRWFHFMNRCVPPHKHRTILRMLFKLRNVCEMTGSRRSACTTRPLGSTPARLALWVLRRSAAVVRSPRNPLHVCVNRRSAKRR